MIRVLFLLFCFFVFFQCVKSENSIKLGIHSHNDYEQDIPFWTAYKNGLNSIEIDLYLKNDSLYVTHSESEIIKDRTIEELYLNPLSKVASRQFDIKKKLQILIDIKSESHKALNRLIKTFNCYPEIINKENISIVISGNRPVPKKYVDYPEFIYFDYQSLDPVENEKIWNKIALISLNFKKYSSWNGERNISKEDFKKLDSLVRLAHYYKKPFRFWGTPDNKIAWEVFQKLGVDYINTDKPIQVSTYFNELIN
jgi:alkaline phosphatase